MEQEIKNKFSWQRVWEFGMIYKSSIKVQLLLYAVITILSYIAIIPFSDVTSTHFIPIYSLLSIVVAYELYVSPVVFGRIDESLLVQLPVKTSEKMTFYLLYILVLLPCYVEALWYGSNFIGNHLFGIADVMTASNTFVKELYEVEVSSSVFICGMVNSIMQTAAIVMTTLFVVLKAHGQRVLKGLLTPLVIIISIGVVSGIGGFIVAITSTVTALSNSEDVGEHVVQSLVNRMPVMTMCIATLMLIYCVIIGICTYRLVRNRQIS